MHGMPRPKPGATQDLAKQKKKAAKAALYGQLTAEVLTRHATRRYDDESMQLSASLLELNPEVYTVWNYRREHLGPVLSRQSTDAAKCALAAELALTKKALALNPKSYATWHHRRWTVVTGGANLENELVLVYKLLSLDSRNFHGWAYWRWLTARMQLSSAAALEYTAQHLREDFSNYSAWHARTSLLAAAAACQPARVTTFAELLAGNSSFATQPAATQSSRHAETSETPRGNAHSADTVLPSTTAIPASVLSEEFEMTHRAFWTEPKDQSAWLYHRWLLGCCLAAAALESTKDGTSPTETTTSDSMHEAEGDRLNSPLLSRLKAEATICEELLKEEPDAKWPLLTLTRIREFLAVTRGQQDSSSTTDIATSPSEDHSQAVVQKLPQNLSQLTVESSADTATIDNAIAYNEDENSRIPSSQPPPSEVQAYARLAAVDPLRSGYYQDAAASRARIVLRPAALF